MSNVKATEGQWYADRATHDIFCVIAVDEVDGLIDVRDGYGDIDEFDVDEWSAMDLELCAAPRELALDDADDEEIADEAEDTSGTGARPGRGAAADSVQQGPVQAASHHIKSSGTT